MSLPTIIAKQIMLIPSQERSKEIASILDAEFKRRAFMKNLEKIHGESAILTADEAWPKMKHRPIRKV